MNRTRLLLPAIALAGILAVGLACGPGFDEGESGLFEPGLGATKHLSAFLYDPTTAGFGHVYGYGDHFHAQNLLEWQEWFGCDSSALVQWETILYRGNRSQIDSALAALKGKGTFPSIMPQGQPHGIPPLKLVPALRYLRFAIGEELVSHASPQESWEVSDRPADSAWSPESETDPEQEALKENDPFLRQRWLFQAAKARFYLQDEGLETFLESHKKALQGPNQSLWWRTRMYLAGSLRRQGRMSHANLLCAQVATSFPLLAEMAANDFRIQEEMDWRSALASAGTPEERNALWLLVGLRTGDLGICDTILREDSASPYPALLATRQLGRMQWGHDTASAPLRGLARRLAPSRRTNDPAFWNLLAGHLTGLEGDTLRAQAWLDSAQRLAGNRDTLIAQVRMSRLLVRLVGSRAGSASLEAYLMSELPQLDSMKLLRWNSFDVSVREEMGRIWKAELPLAWTLSDRICEDPDTLALLARFRSTLGRPFAEFAKRRCRRTLGEIGRRRGTALLYRNRTAEAVAILELEGGSDTLGTDPFNAEISDNHDRDHERFSNHPMTRLDYAREILRLEGLARGQGPEAAKASLRLGIGLYNRTFFGNARSLYLGQLSEAGPLAIDLKPARRQFERAARDLPTAEGHAWATWLVAKCARDQDSTGTAPIQEYVKLRKLYGGTPFWKRALKECGWLSGWNQRQRKI